MSVSLSEVKRAAKAHRAPLAGESAGYLVLAIADQVLSAPRLVEPSEIELTEDGALRVRSGQASSDAEAELALRRALDQLLLVASSGSAALTRASRRTSPVGLSLLVRELEAALIPVNRAAARRTLARLYRETARAVASGLLPADEDPPAPVIASPVVALGAAPAVSLASTVARDEPEEDEPQTQALPVREASGPQSSLDVVLSALSEQLLLPPELQESDALTHALEVRALSATPPDVELDLEIELEMEMEIDIDIDTDIEAEAEAVDSSAAPTVVQAIEVQPVAPFGSDAESLQPMQDPPIEACTRPEPVVLRKSQRGALWAALPSAAQSLLHTPTLGSLAAQLPVLARERIAALSVVEDESARTSLENLTVALQNEPATEQMPEVAPLSPGVAMVASRQSDVSELVNRFQIAPNEPEQDFCRALKEMAELDLTPGPFAALVREVAR